MELRDALQLRLRNQRLAGEKLRSPAEAVGWFGAVQGQEYNDARWAVGWRTADRTASRIDDALAEGSIIRTHVLRPTWHFVAREDFRWLMALSGPRVIATTLPRQRQLGIDEETMAAVRKALAKALEGGRALARPELQAVLREGGVSLDEDPQRFPWLMMIAELEGFICSGPRQGRQHTWALADERVPPAPPLTRDEALRELTLRYFRAHGPATVRDFAWWSGFTLTDCRRGIEMARDNLEEDRLGEEPCYLLADSPAPDSPRDLYLLAPFDEYTVGYAAANRRHLARNPAHAGENLLDFAIVDRDGHVVGAWQRRIAPGAVTIRPAFFEPPSAADVAAFEAAAGEFAASLGLPAEIQWDA